jgi:hypothetical protein
MFIFNSLIIKTKFLSIGKVNMSAGGFRLPPISGIPALSTIERAAVLDVLFEPCTALHSLSLDLLRTEKFESYNDLIASVGVQLTDLSESPSTSDTEWLDKILGAHPRLGEKKVDSAQSQAEQAQLNTGGEEEATMLRNLNAEYEKTFHGLKYVYGCHLYGAFKTDPSTVFSWLGGQGRSSWKICDHGSTEETSSLREQKLSR